MARERTHNPAIHGDDFKIVVSVTGEKRVLIRSGKRSVWYVGPGGNPRQCSMENWMLWRAGKGGNQKGGAE